MGDCGGVQHYIMSGATGHCLTVEKVCFFLRLSASNLLVKLLSFRLLPSTDFNGSMKYLQ